MWAWWNPNFHHSTHKLIAKYQFLQSIYKEQLSGVIWIISTIFPSGEILLVWIQHPAMILHSSTVPLTAGHQLAMVSTGSLHKQTAFDIFTFALMELECLGIRILFHMCNINDESSKRKPDIFFFSFANSVAFLEL